MAIIAYLCAMNSEQGKSYNISIAKETIHDFDAVTFDGTITVIDTVEAADKAIAELERETIVGFDTETKPTFRKGPGNPVALMQISTDTHGYLFRLNKIGFPDSLRRFIENGNVRKIGLSLKDDFFVMHRNGQFEPAGFLDLQKYVGRFKIADCSLQRIYAILFNRRISKGQRLSNWEASKLTSAQQAYAVIDAWACLKIYNYLEEGRFNPETSPYKVYPEELPA